MKYTAPKKAENMIVTLKDKTKVTIDLYALSIGEVRSILDGKKDKADPYSKEDEIIAKAAGLNVEKLQALPFPDYRKVIRAFWDCIRDPLKDDGEEKNSVSVSTSE